MVVRVTVLALRCVAYIGVYRHVKFGCRGRDSGWGAQSRQSCLPKVFEYVDTKS